MATLLQNFRFSIRQLRKAPGFAFTAILTLALGIGAAASIFSVVNTVLLKPFAFRDPSRLVVMREVVEEIRKQEPAVPDNYLHYLRLKKDSKTLEDAAIFQDHGASVSPDGDHPHIVDSIAASPNFFRVLGVEPMLGRDFVAKDAEKGANDVVILSYEGWKTLMNGDPDVIGKTLRMDGKPNTIIGVLPPGVRFPEIAMAPDMPSQASVATSGMQTMIFDPLVPSADDLKNDAYNYNFQVIARLKPDVTLAEARAELGGLQHAYALSAHLPIHIGISLTPLASDVTAGISTALWLLFAAVGCVLLIACANLANLQLARAVAAEHETAIRAALGASRKQLLLARWTESFLLAAVGGTGGVALTFLGVRLLLLVAPANVPRLTEVQVNVPVLLFAVGISALSAILFGILPALRALHVQPQAALQSQSSRVATSREGRSVRGILVAAEIASTVILLVITALVLHSFGQLLRQNRGFDSDHVTVAQVNLFAPQYGDDRPNFKTAKAAYIDRSLVALQALPGVQSVTMTSATPLTGETWVDNLSRPDDPLPPAEQPLVNVRFISPGYLATMHIPLISGRNLSAADRTNPYVVLLSEKAARVGFPGKNPIGRKLDSIDPNDNAHPFTVIGVVANTRVNGLRDTAAMAYVPYWVYPPWAPAFLVRSSQSSDAIIPEMRRVLWNIDPQVAIPTLKSLDEQVSDSVATDRFQAILLSSFGAAALLLALLGVYGVLAYSVTLRQQEFGIRIALGSDKARLTALVLRQAAWPVLGGTGAGSLLAVVATKWVQSLLYETKANDPLAIGGSLLLLITVAGSAAVLPARRAAQVDPIQVLRNE
jgi:putative ABC transport system permease protein